MRLTRLIFMVVLAGAAGLSRAQVQPAAASRPASEARPVAPQYWFGVAVENIPPAIARQLKLKPDQGVIVIAVIEGSPAARAGLQNDDLLIALNGKPLTSQEELARAANTVVPATAPVSATAPAKPAAVTPAGLPASGPVSLTSEIVFLREGVEHKVNITPQPRPREMLVSGAGLRPFTAGTQPTGEKGIEVRNYTLGNGAQVYVGPGYQFDSKAQGSSVNSYLEAVAKNKQVVVTKETDSAGKTRITISDGQNQYLIEREKLDTLPANLRPLAEQMLGTAKPAASEPSGLEERLRQIEQQNQELRKKLDDVQQMLMQNATRPAAKP